MGEVQGEEGCGVGGTLSVGPPLCSHAALAGRPPAPG